MKDILIAILFGLSVFAVGYFSGSSAKTMALVCVKVMAEKSTLDRALEACE